MQTMASDCGDLMNSLIDGDQKWGITIVNGLFFCPLSDLAESADGVQKVGDAIEVKIAFFEANS
jgi:hypothetical protein